MGLFRRGIKPNTAEVVTKGQGVRFRFPYPSSTVPHTPAMRTARVIPPGG